LKLFNRKLRKNEAIGVEFTSEGVAFAYVQRPATQEPRLVYCEYLPCDASANVSDVLRQRLVKLGLQHLPSTLVMNSSQYQLLLGDAPKVPAEELAEALRWRVKDLIQFPIADAIIDAFLLPEDSARGVSRMAYAVVAQRNQVTQLIAQAKAAQLQLENIDIPELVLRNLAQTCCDTKRGIALIKLGQGGGSLQIIRDGSLYLSRQFSLAYNGGLLDEIPAEALVLEVQRSLDYFERQMRQSPPSHVYLCGENITNDKLTTQIRSSLAVTINLLDVHTGLQIDKDVQEHNLSLCLLALGAALRQDVVEAA
jgi:MSHA biogenesis protein MshI